MSYLLRRTKRRYRDLRPSREEPRLAFHIGFSFILSSIITIVATLVGQQQIIQQNIAHLHRFVGTCFALLFSVLAIVLAFRRGASSERPINELERVGLLSNIIQRFYLSVFVVGILYFVLTGISVFGLLSVTAAVTVPMEPAIRFDIVELVILSTMMFSLVITMVRTASCFHLFYRLEKNLR